MAYSKKVIVLEKNKKGEKGLFTTAKVQKDEILIEFSTKILEHPTRISLQIDENKHIKGTADTNAFLNHNCEPNAYIDFAGVYLRALKNIKKGEEITYNYLTTEWILHKSFICNCGSFKCYGEIKGFKYLDKKQKLELKLYLSPYLKKKLEENEGEL